MERHNTYLPENLAAKNILITGGTTGIGRATAMMLTELGANVMIIGRDREDLDTALQDLRGIGSENNIFGMNADTSIQDDVKKVFNEFDSRFGKLDVLINNAALPYQSVADGTVEERRYALDTNIGGYVEFAHEAAERMKKTEGGHIVNVGSMSADVREKESSVYVATKAAIQGFTGALRKELNPHKIKVTLIEPGATATDMQKGESDELDKQVQDYEMLDASDVAAAIVYGLSQPRRCNVVVVQVKPLLQIV